MGSWLSLSYNPNKGSLLGQLHTSLKDIPLYLCEPSEREEPTLWSSWFATQTISQSLWCLEITFIAYNKTITMGERVLVSRPFNKRPSRRLHTTYANSLMSWEVNNSKFMRCVWYHKKWKQKSTQWHDYKITNF